MTGSELQLNYLDGFSKRLSLVMKKTLRNRTFSRAYPPRDDRTGLSGVTQDVQEGVNGGGGRRGVDRVKFKPVRFRPILRSMPGSAALQLMWTDTLIEGG